MRRHHIQRALLAVLVFCTVPAMPALGNEPAAMEMLHGRPLYFEENRGAWPPEVRFASRASDYLLLLSETDVHLSLPGESRRAGIRLHFLAENARPVLEPVAPLPGIVNYLSGSDPEKWVTGVRTWSRVRYRRVRPGVDVVFYADGRHLAFDLHLKAHIDPRSVVIRYEGVDKLSVDGDGNLVLASGKTSITQVAPKVYQEGPEGRLELISRYRITGAREVSFDIESVDPRQALVIDPAFVATTVFSTNPDEGAEAVAVDVSGNIYLAGWTTEFSGFPLDAGLNGFAPVGSAGEDGFVTKLDPSGTTLLFTTFISGTGDDRVSAMTLDPFTGTVWAVGRTESANFPTLNALYPSFSGVEDGFLMAFDPSGAPLLYSTYLGGSFRDRVIDVTLDDLGRPHVVGETWSPDFPVLNAVDSLCGSDGTCLFGVSALADLFVTQFAAGGQSLLFSTFLGGAESEAAAGIAVDPAGRAFVAGTTYSPDFPLVGGTLQPYNGSGDAVLVVLDPAAGTLLLSDFIGGSGNDTATDVAADDSDAVYVVGRTSSNDLPTHDGPYPGAPNFGGFFARFSMSSLNRQLLSYYPRAEIEAVAVDGMGGVYFAGMGDNGMPLQRALQPVRAGGTDAFVARLSSGATSVEFATFVGGPLNDRGTDVAVDGAGEHVYLAGEGSTYWSDLPAAVLVDTASTNLGDEDAWVSHIDQTIMTADLELEKVGVQLFNGKAQFTIEVRNDGPDDGLDVVVTDSLPGNASFDSASSTNGSCSESAGTLTCDVGTVFAEDSQTITVTMTPDAGATELENSASLTASSEDPDPGNNADAATLPLGLEANIVLSMTIGDPEVLLNDTFSRVITVNNYGAAGATDVTVSVETNAASTLTGAVPSQGSCNLAVEPAVCDLGTINNGNNVTIAVDYQAIELGAIEVSASATSGNPDPDPWNNDSTELLSSVPRIDLACYKTFNGPSPATVGVPMTYAVAADNLGPDTATGVELHDVFLSGSLTIDSVVPTSGTCNVDGMEVVCMVGDVLSGEIAEMFITVTPLIGGEITNDSFVTNTNGDRDLLNNREAIAVDVRSNVNLGVLIADTPDPSFEQEQITYTVTVSNAGPHAVSQALLLAQFSGPLQQIDSLSITHGGCSYESWSSVADCQLGALGAGAVATLTMVITPGGPGTLELTATVGSAIPLLEDDWDSSDNQAIEETAVTVFADLGVSAEDPNGPVVVGNRLSTRVTVSNDGPHAATGVTLTSTLPPGVVVISASPEQGTCSDGAGVITCDLGVMNPSTSVLVDLVLEPGVVGTLMNDLSVSAIQNDTDPSDDSILHPTEILDRAAGDFAIVDLGTLGGVDSYAYGINQAGQVVGEARNGSNLARAFLWEEGSGMTDLGTLPGWSESVARDINDSERIVGWSGEGGFYRDPGGVLEPIGLLPASSPFSQSRGVNAPGAVVGFSRDITDATQAVRWTDLGGIAGLGSPSGFSEAAAINGSGVVVGRYSGGAFVYSDGLGMLDLAGLAGTSTRAEDINEAGEVAGKWRPDGSTPFHAYRFVPPLGDYTQPAGMVDLGTLGGTTSNALALNDSQQVVGLSETLYDLEERAALWQHGIAWDLNSLLPAFSGWETLLAATDLNDQAQIVGYGVIGGEVHAFRMTGTCRDEDGDGHGALGLPVCPAGPLPDCDDTDPSRFPGNPELCDGVDNDCDGSLPVSEMDDDLDGYSVCEGDCDDADSQRYPGAPELNDAVDQSCPGEPGYGLIDEMSTYLRWFNQGNLFWEEQPGAWLHEIVRAGDPQFTTGCTSWTSEDPDMGRNEIPAFGQVDHFLIRPLAPNEGSWGADSNGVERAPCPGPCAHDKCVEGASLFSSCDSCVTLVCQNWPGCCSANRGWDSFCAEQVRTTCGSLSCSDSQGACSHSVCTQGTTLVPGCDDPPVSPSCVSVICAVDSYCCNTDWDSLCVGEVTSLCGYTCQ